MFFQISFLMTLKCSLLLFSLLDSHIILKFDQFLYYSRQDLPIATKVLRETFLQIDFCLKNKNQ